jgi:hypothetical protein
VEGYGRRRYKHDFMRFITYALASNDETTDHLETLRETAPLSDDAVFTNFHSRLDELGRKWCVQGSNATGHERPLSQHKTSQTGFGSEKHGENSLAYYRNIGWFSDYACCNWNLTSPYRYSTIAVA